MIQDPKYFRYEVGKYQTLGGSIFQQGTVCTIATYDPYDMDVGGGDIGNDDKIYITLKSSNVLCAGYSSRKQSPSGDFVNATGTLTVVDQPGHFLQELFFFGFAGPSVDYNVVWLDEDTAIEYVEVVLTDFRLLTNNDKLQKSRLRFIIKFDLKLLA